MDLKSNDYELANKASELYILKLNDQNKSTEFMILVAKYAASPELKANFIINIGLNMPGRGMNLTKSADVYTLSKIYDKLREVDSQAERFFILMYKGKYNTLRDELEKYLEKINRYSDFYAMQLVGALSDDDVIRDMIIAKFAALGEYRAHARLYVYLSNEMFKKYRYKGAEDLVDAATWKDASYGIKKECC